MISPEFRQAVPTLAPASELIRAMTDEMVDRYGLIDGRVGTPLDMTELMPPTGTYLVGWHDGEAIAGGGLRRLEDGIVEIKRMYVLPSLRGQGVASALLLALEAAARDLGFVIARLDTGRFQPDAVHLYLRSGYQSVSDYNNNPHASFWGEKDLTQS